MQVCESNLGEGEGRERKRERGQRVFNGVYENRIIDNECTYVYIGSSVDPILLDKLEEVLPGYRKPSCLYGVRCVLACVLSGL